MTLASIRETAKRLLSLFCAVAILASSVAVPVVQAQSLPLIRDAEIEGLMRLYTRPIFKAAGLNPKSVNVYLINQSGINAFVAGGQRIFIHTGLLQQAETPNEVIGVLAHEAGHIAGGHLSRLGTQIEKASTLAIISMLVGAAVVVGGAVSGAKGADQIGQATIVGGQSVAQRYMLSYVRAQESAADQAAMKYLTRTGQSGKGTLELFQKLASQSIGSLRRTNPYTLTHPMPFERIRNLERLAKKSKFYNKKDSGIMLLRHHLMQAKLAGFLSSPRVVFRKYPRNNNSLPSRYARAIVSFRTGDIKNALPLIDSLIKEIPQNPYFWELKGQALLETGRAREAIKPLKTAVSKSGNNGLIGMLLARAYLDVGGKANAKTALGVLNKAKRRENDSPQLHFLLARAYGIRGNIAQAELETAEYALRRGDKQLALQKAKNALKRLKRGSPSRQRAVDIVNFASRK
ncbi:Putative Zn-dependent protease, contains TPR repeats [hydrothermal vent metagenome]|uniref:Zn-dependent protease, contains TPR repeats n=1 Tax=hydrothermal vent metagenome TaxID=652676 RepID=A0A3B0RCX8_9ZZZZ